MISVLGEAMRMRASCGALPPGSNMRHTGRALSDRGILPLADVSLVREAQCSQKLGIIRSVKVAMLMDQVHRSGWTERAWRGAAAPACCAAPTRAAPIPCL